MVSKFCGKCGTVNTAQTNFCVQCGLHLVTAAEPSKAVNQPAPVSHNLPPPPPNSPPPNSYPPFRENSFPVPNVPFTAFQQNSGSPNSFTPPPPYVQSAYQSPPMPLSPTVAGQKRGTGAKLLSVAGTVVVGLFFLLKGGSVLLRLGSLGGVGVALAVVIILAIIVIRSLVKRSCR